MKRTSRVAARGRHSGQMLLHAALAVTITSAVLAAAPSWISAFLTEHQLHVESLALSAALNAARFAAVDRHRAVVMCPSSAPGAGTDNACSESANDWSNGWLMFTKAPAGSEAEAEADADALISRGPAVPGRIAIETANTVERVVFAQDGTLENGARVDFFIRAAGSSGPGRHLSVDGRGQLTLVTL